MQIKATPMPKENKTLVPASGEQDCFDMLYQEPMQKLSSFLSQNGLIL